jgi:hypothetical protein
VPDPVRIEDLTPLTALAQAQSTISDLEQRVSELERVGDALSAKNEALAEWRRLRAGGEA